MAIMNNIFSLIYIYIIYFNGDWGLGPIPNPQSPIPNPQSPIPIYDYNNKKLVFLKSLIKLFKDLINYFKTISFKVNIYRYI